jgi:DNA-binding transcriptional ArsR family regulator
MARGKRKGDEDRAQEALRALNHDLRRRILRVALDGREAVSPTEVARTLGAPLSSVSYHFRVLAESGALDIAREQPVRGSIKHFYRANAAVAEMPMVAEILAATSPTD